MAVKNIPQIHEQILNFLLKWRKRNPEFTFTLRKSDISKRLSNGYWFHGNDDYIAISFWTGMDWQSKVPNISLVYIPSTNNWYVQFSAKDSPEKEQLILLYFIEYFKLQETSRGFYSKLYSTNESQDFLNTLNKFLLNDKIFIDNIIVNNKKSFNTKQNTKNRIGFILEEDFAKNLSKTLKYQKKKTSENIPIGLFEIEIENYGLIKKLIINEIPANAQWIFFTGENGSGKTTILKALATALTNSTLGLGPKTSMSGDFSIGLTLQKNGKKTQKHRIKKNTTSTKKGLEILSKGLVCFGPVRLNIQDQVFSVVNKSKTKTLLDIFNRPHIQLFSTISLLIDIGYVYNRNYEISKELKNNKEKLKFIMETITSICDSIVDIHFGNGIRYFEVDKSQKPIGNGGTPFHQLASGYKSIIAMISHMMLHLYYQQPEIDDPSALEGIVIIDEIDLHFHPKMQRDLVIKLSEIFPRIQFIASTHSPIPLLGVPASTPIFTSKIDSEMGIYIERMDRKVMFSDILPNAILTSPIFDLEEIIPLSHNNKKLIRTEDTFKEILENDKTRIELKKIARKLRK